MLTTPTEADARTEVLCRLADAASGPAVVMAGTGGVVFANARARMLLELDGTWCEDLADWLDPRGGALAAGRVSRIPTPRGPVDVEWSSLCAGSDSDLRLVLGRDCTFESQLRTALTESRQRYKDLVEISSDFAWETGPDGRFVFVSPGGALGYAADALIGRDPADLLLPEEDAAVLRAEDEVGDSAAANGAQGAVGADFDPFRADRRVENVPTWRVNAAGNPVCLSVSALPLVGSTRRWIGARGVCRDITEQLNRTFELAQMRMGDALLNRIGQALRDRVEDAGTLEFAAEETAQVLGAEGCVLCRLPASGEALENTAQFGALPFSLDAGLPAVLDSGTATEQVAAGYRVIGQRTDYRGLVNGAVLVWRPARASAWTPEETRLLAGIAQRLGVALAKIAHHEHLRTLSERDALTGVFNRRGFAGQLAETLMTRHTGPSALLYIDLDNFKAVNDTLGHNTGDTVLRELARLLTEHSRPGDVSGRLGGDEFVLWLARAGEAEAEIVARRLLDGVSGLGHLSASPERPLSLSIGIAVRDPGAGESLSALIQRADQAMYVAKAAGKNQYSVAAPRSGGLEALEDRDDRTGG